MNINLTSSNFCNNTSKINDNECSVDKVGYKTYAKIVAPNDSENDNKLSLIPMCIEEGKEVVVFDEEIVREGSRKWALTLCGHFVGCKMSYFELRESKGMSYVLENGPWMVNNKPLMVQKCELDVVIDRSEPKSLTCWIKLHNIPLEAWTSKGISAIASGLDKPLIMDKTTTMICKGGHGNYGYARVLVEIQVDKEFKDVVEICYKSNHQRTKCSKFVNVEYSWKPPKCCKCENDRKMKDGQGNRRVQTRVEYMPVVREKGGKEKTQTPIHKNNDSNMNKPQPSLKSPTSPWRISKENVEELRRSANKYAILEEIDENGDQESQIQNGREIVDKFVKYQRQPTIEDSEKWNTDMF
ncbi:RNA-directed DNA polymerase, eukaryota, reverse transcriptase zinc-binding domain protein [Tanacetum coccineum]